MILREEGMVYILGFDWVVRKRYELTRVTYHVGEIDFLVLFLGIILSENLAVAKHSADCLNDHFCWFLFQVSSKVLSKNQCRT